METIFTSGLKCRVKFKDESITQDYFSAFLADLKEAII
jgi:hypothetical protein